MPSEKLRHLIMKEEGLRLVPYKDRHNLWAAGFGHIITEPRLIEALNRGDRVFVPMHTAYEWLQEDLEDHMRLVRHYFGHLGLSEPRLEVLAGLSYQMGIHDLMEFERMIEALEQEDWDEAARELLDSRYGKEQTPARARRMAKYLREGQIPEPQRS